MQKQCTGDTPWQSGKHTCTDVPCSSVEAYKPCTFTSPKTVSTSLLSEECIYYLPNVSSILKFILRPGPPLRPLEDDNLPSYTNNVRLATLCYHKREFDASFDKTPHRLRSWGLVWLVLDGTALRVYKAGKTKQEP